MAKIGVGLGLAKSIIGRSNPPVMEFAKRFLVGEVDASGVSFRDIITALLSTSSASSFINRTSYSLNSYLVLRGYGYRSRSKVTHDL
jgi:hypothetical protein